MPVAGYNDWDISVCQIKATSSTLWLPSDMPNMLQQMINVTDVTGQTWQAVDMGDSKVVVLVKNE